MWCCCCRVFGAIRLCYSDGNAAILLRRRVCSPNNSKFLIFVKNHHHYPCSQFQHWPDDCSVAKQTRKQIKWLAVETQTQSCVFIQGVVLRVFIQGVVLTANTVTHRKHREQILCLIVYLDTIILKKNQVEN